MTTLIGILAIVLIFFIIFQLAKASELMGVLKGEKEGETSDSTNNTHGLLLMLFMIVGLAGVVLGWLLVQPYLLQGNFDFKPASAHGDQINSTFWITTAVCGIVFFLTQAILFWFAYKYRQRKGHKAHHFSHDNKLEIIWTVIPAIVLTVLVARGIEAWYDITGDAPSNHRVVEVTAQQFNWIVRYPGADTTLGLREFELYSQENSLGINWEDPASHDDLMPTEIVLEKGVPVLFKLGAKDVLHSFYLTHFMVKQDCVPGIPTQFWMTPTITTDSMRIILNNPEFDYELACAELCGKAHWNMRFVVKVVEKEEYNEWFAAQKPYYEVLTASAAPTVPATDAVPADTDSSSTVAPLDSTQQVPATMEGGQGMNGGKNEKNVISSL